MFKKIILIIVVAMGATLLMANDEEKTRVDDFHKANIAFSEKNYPLAIEYYEKVIAYEPTPNVLYNLATAYTQDNQIGRAIEYYEKTLALDTNYKDAKARLAALRDKYKLNDCPPEVKRKLAALLTYHQWLLMIVITFWFTVIFWILGQYYIPSYRLYLQIIAILLLLLFIMSSYALWSYRLLRQQAIVVLPSQLQVSPAIKSEIIIDLPEGEAIRILENFNDFYRFEILNGQIGWVPKENVSCIYKEKIDEKNKAN